MSGEFVSVRTVGGLLPPDVLARVLAGDVSLGGLRPADYHLAAGETPREAANRAWSYLTGVWASYRAAMSTLPEGDAAVGLTRSAWLGVLLRELGYGQVPLTGAGGIVVAEDAYLVSHLWGATPMHLLGWGVDLDRRTKGVPGAAGRAPHAMVQELLNRSDEHLWAVVSNGRVLRLLRDSTSLAGQAFVEFDLEAMFDGEVFSDFVLLYLLVHQSRVEVPAGADGSPGRPAECWLERWRTAAAESGTRALGLLRDGVREAIEALGSGFLAANPALNDDVAAGRLRLDDYHRALLRLVYRLLFLFVAEDRDALLLPVDGDTDRLVARERYDRYFSTGRLRRLALRRRGAGHGDLWEALRLVIDALGREDGRPELALPGIGGLFDHGETDVVMEHALPNSALLTAVRSLTVVQPKGQPRRVVDYRNLGAEELGSIYESLLELVPRHDAVMRAFTLAELAGNERKTSGSYYTPSALIDLVLDEALDPLLDEADKADDPEAALLAVTVCDPACGSGHFLVAAARRLALRVAAVRTREIDPTPTAVSDAMHDVVAASIYGVDLNPMAADLAKVSLWLESMTPGRPLSFLDAHIKVGNALLGTTPALLAAGIPDAAYSPIEGDDKKTAAAWKKANKLQRDADRAAQDALFDTAGLAVGNTALRHAVDEADAAARAALSLTDVHLARTRYREIENSPEARAARMLADTWCAAFVAPKNPDAVALTHDALTTPTPAVEELVADLAAQYRFFHWHLEFPDIFRVPDHGPAADTTTGWHGGFTAMVGNPPFLSQLSSETAVTTVRGLRRTRAAADLGAYTDESAVFLAVGTGLAAPGGSVGFIQPQSVLASRDAEGVRRWVARRARLVAFWWSDVPVFGASVITVALILSCEVEPRSLPVRCFLGPRYLRAQAQDPSDWYAVGLWAKLIATMMGVTSSEANVSGCVADLAKATADFRQQYYGLEPFVFEGLVAARQTGGRAWAPLVTTGMIDPGECAWARVNTKYMKRNWAAPAVDLEAMREGDLELHEWAVKRLRPKILVATQGKVIEAVVDLKGQWLPCVPLITVSANSADDLWLVYAVLMSPHASAWCFGVAAGAGIGATSLKVSAKQVQAIPLPADVQQWSAAADVLRSGAEPSGEVGLDSLVLSASLMTAAYGADPEEESWWVGRVASRGNATVKVRGS